MPSEVVHGPDLLQFDKMALLDLEEAVEQERCLIAELPVGHPTVHCGQGLDQRDGGVQDLVGRHRRRQARTQGQDIR